MKLFELVNVRITHTRVADSCLYDYSSNPKGCTPNICDGGVRKCFCGANPQQYHISWIYIPLSHTRLDLYTPKPYQAGFIYP